MISWRRTSGTGGAKADGKGGTGAALASPASETVWRRRGRGVAVGAGVATLVGVTANIGSAVPVSATPRLAVAVRAGATARIGVAVRVGNAEPRVGDAVRVGNAVGLSRDMVTAAGIVAGG